MGRENFAFCFDFLLSYTCVSGCAVDISFVPPLLPFSGEPWNPSPRTFRVRSRSSGIRGTYETGIPVDPTASEARRDQTIVPTRPPVPATEHNSSLSLPTSRGDQGIRSGREEGSKGKRRYKCNVQKGFAGNLLNAILFSTCPRRPFRLGKGPTKTTLSRSHPYSGSKW